MRIGVLARADARGIAYQTHEFARHLNAVPLVIRVPDSEARGFPFDPSWFPDAPVVTWDGQLDEQICRWWLRRVDVVYAVETTMDQRFPLWAAEARVGTVLHVNPELLRDDHTPPSAWWAPTDWRLDQLPAGTRVVPYPVALDRFRGTPPEPHDGPLRVLHVVGHQAAADRNGTQLFRMALRHVRQPVQVRVVCQDRRLRLFRYPPNMTVETVLGGVTDNADLYADADVLVLPRRYGGLSLVTQEAMASGLAVIMPDCPPNPTTWPIVPVRASPQGHLRCAAGTIRTHSVDVRQLARTIDQLAADRDVLVKAQRASIEWAEAHSWDTLGPSWRQELAQACP